MKNYTQQHFTDRIPTLSRCKSHDYYFAQANQFEKRYRHSLVNSCHIKQYENRLHQCWQHENKALNQNIQQLTLKISNLQKQNLSLESTLKVLSQKIAFKQKVLDQKQNDISLQKQKITQLQKQLKATDQKYLNPKENSQNANIQKLTTLQNQFLVLRERSQQKDKKIQALIIKVETIQSQLQFFKNKFINLLSTIEKEIKQSANIFQHALTIKQQALKLYQAPSTLKQTQAIDLQSQTRSARTNQNTPFDPALQKLIESSTLVKQRFGQSYTGARLMESGQDLTYRFPSLNININPIRMQK